MLFQTSIKRLFIVKHKKNNVLNDVRPHSLSMYEIKFVNIPSVPELCLDQHDGEYALKKECLVNVNPASGQKEERNPLSYSLIFAGLLK